MTASSVKRTAPSVGDDFATDLVSGKHHQVVTPAEPPTLYKTTGSALENDVEVKAAAGTIIEIQVVLGAGQPSAYLHLFDQIGAAAGNPFFWELIPAGGSITVTPQGGLSFATGIRAAISSTLPTFTDLGANVAMFWARGN